ncbi:MAG TPA: hypothetical protein VEO54_11100 [Thermoanaerobaculia bacterium]|nr:hypothetical protein [Thermoanaerobaculia bacterium]
MRSKWLAVLLFVCGSVQAAGFGSLPADFVENQGQWSAPARFVAWTGSSTASLTPDAIVLRSADEVVHLTFENRRPGVELVGEAKRRGTYNFFLGADPARWCARVPSFGSILYRGVYDGVDVRVRRGDSSPLAYDVVLAPGADLGKVVIRAAEARELELETDGTLVIHTAAGTIRQSPPRTWEVLPDGSQRPIASRFRLIDETRYGFTVPGREPRLAMVIDPGLEWSTFLGGGDREEMTGGVAATTDGSGDVIVAGKTWSGDFPATSGGKGASPLVPFVARFNSTGSELVYATLFGSTNGWVAHLHDLALDASSAPILVGETNGADFPTTPGAYDPTFNEPSAPINRGWDAFITRFDATGSRMVFSTFLGAAPIFDSSRAGSMRGGEEAATAVAVDASDSVIVAGWTRSEDFPTTPGAYDRTLDPIQVAVELNGVPGIVESRVDAFVARFNPAGSQLLYSTYLGGQADDLFRDLAVDASGVVTLTGVQAPIETPDGRGGRQQHGRPFPTTADAWARTHLGASDAILARLKLDGAGSADLQYATILGGTYIDEAGGVALDPASPERIALSGWSRSWDFPTTAGTIGRAPLFMVDGSPYYFGFAAQFRFPAAGGGALQWSTIIEGNGAQVAEDVAIDASGDVIVIGTDESGVATTERAWKRYPSGVFVSRLSPDGKQLRYATLLHPSSTLFHDFLHVASAGPGSVLVSGSTLRPDFPTTPGAFDRVFNSDGTGDGFHRSEGFVAKLTLEAPPSADTTAAAPALVSPANGAAFPTGTSTLLFDWTDVADPSGVQVYEVALAANPDFAVGYGFRMPGFVPASQWETWFSGDGVYYWRVRTLDGANNFSPWSETRSFQIGATNWTNFCAVTLTPAGVPGGSTVQGKLYILNAAPAGGITYTLTSSNPAVASVPPSVTVPAGANTASFTVSTNAVSKSTPVQLTVWAEGNGDHPVLWVDPAPAGVLALSSVTLTPSSVTGGSASQGTVTLNGAASEEGAVVTLSSSNPAAAAVPPSVTVSPGMTTATFAVTTQAVSSSTAVTIGAAYAGATRSATLTLTPPPVPAAPSLLSPANDATPAQPVAFDWSDVSGAASYTIQIDDSSTFTAPLLVSNSVTASQTTIGNLPARQLWWRVRALSSAGNAGNWSAVRRFTPQGTSSGTVGTPSLVAPSADARFSPGQSITFDWSDVAGAVSYTIQIDDDDRFSSPQVRSATTSPSTYSTNTLPTRTMWWRVRANAANGTSGNWSAVRRFEVKD